MKGEHPAVRTGVTAVPATDQQPVAISIIIPAYQEGTRLDTLLGQLPQSLRARYSVEVIVSDGGSSDETLSCARAGADLVVEHTGTRRQTIGEGRNRGADVARGRVLVFLNADVTLADPAMFLHRLDGAFRGEPIAAASCRVMVEPSEEKRIDRLIHTPFNAWCRLLTALGIGMARGECQAVSSELFRTIGGYNETLAAAEDYDLFRRIGRKGRVRFLADVTVFESPRRYRLLGYPKVLTLWFLNALSVALRGRALSSEWTPVR